MTPCNVIVWQRFCEPARLRIANCPCLSCPTSYINRSALSDLVLGVLTGCGLQLCFLIIFFWWPPTLYFLGEGGVAGKVLIAVHLLLSKGKSCFLILLQLSLLPSSDTVSVGKSAFRSLLDSAFRDVKNVFQFLLIFARNQYFLYFCHYPTPLPDKLSAEDRSFLVKEMAKTPHTFYLTLPIPLDELLCHRANVTPTGVFHLQPLVGPHFSAPPNISRLEPLSQGSVFFVNLGETLYLSADLGKDHDANCYLCLQ